MRKHIAVAGLLPSAEFAATETARRYRVVAMVLLPESRHKFREPFCHTN